MTVTAPNTNGHITKPSNNATPESNGNIGLSALFTEAQTLKDILCDAYARSNRLLVALKRYQKQSKLVASTLASLRQLQQIEG